MRQRTLSTTPATSTLWSALALGLLLASCSKKPAETPLGAESSDQSAGELAAEPEDTTPLEPAPAPGGVFVRARIQSPRRLLTSIGDAASSPLDLGRVLTDADGKVGRLLETAIDGDGPAEALLALHPVSGQEPMAVWSVSARGVRAALQGLESQGVETRRGPEGLHYFQLAGDDCALGRSLGRSPARIVCADRPESLDSLLAYALRGFPAEPFSEAAASVRIVAEPLQKQYGKQLRGLRLLGGVAARQLHRDSPRFDVAVSDAVLGLVDELIAVGEDARSLTFELWDREGFFEIEAAFDLAGQKSWLETTSREWSKAEGAAPDLAKQLPGEATSVAYLRQKPKKTCERLAKVVGELGAGALESEGISRALADKLARSLSLVFAADRTIVYAVGPLKEGPSGARPRVSWSLLGVDQERSEILEILDGFAAVLSSKELDKVDEVEPDDRPSLARKNLALGAGLTATVYEWRLPEALVSALESGTRELAEEGLSVVGSSDASHLKSGYLAVMPAGGATWLALSSDREGLVESLKKVKGDAPRVTASPELAGFLEQPALAASALRLAGVLDQLSPVLTPKMFKASQQALRTAPHRGVVPITSFVSVTALDATQLKFRSRVPDEFLTDAASVILVLAAEVERGQVGSR